MRLNGNFLEVYDSIDELPYWRFQEYNRAAMLDAEIGSDITAIDRHINQARRYNAAGDVENTEKTLLNLRQALAFAGAGTSPESRAFVALIARINGEVVDSLTDNQVERIMATLSRKGLTVGKLRGILEQVKKKLDAQMETFFPGIADSSQTKEYYTALKQRTELILEGLAGKDTRQAVEKVETLLLKIAPPQNYAAEEVEMIRAYERSCAIVGQHIGRNPKRLTVLEYFETLETLKTDKKKYELNGQPH